MSLATPTNVIASAAKQSPSRCALRWRLLRRFAPNTEPRDCPIVMAGFGPAIHVFLCARITRRGWTAFAGHDDEERPRFHPGRVDHCRTVGTRNNRGRMVAALILFAAPALADDTPPTREVVVTATRVPTPVVDIPAGVSVIDRQTIEERGYTTLTDALVRGSRHPRQPVRRSRRQRERVRPRHQLERRAGAARRHAAERCLRRVRRVQLRRRYPGRCRAHRGYPRPDGGTVRLRCDRRRDQPDLAPRPRTWLPRHRRTRRRLPEAVGGQRQRLRHRRAVRLLGHRAGAGAARLRHHAAAHVDLHRRPRSVQRTDRHAEPRLYADRRHAAVAVPARPTRGVRLRCSRQSHLRQQQLHRPGQQPARPHRRHLEAVQRHFRDRRVSRPAAERPILHRGARSARSQPAEQQLALPQLPHRRAVEQHAAPVRSDRRAVAVGDRSHLRLRAHCRQHQREGEPVLLRLAFRTVGEGVDDRRCGLCRIADHAAAATDADRADPPGLGHRPSAAHLAARRGARRAGGRDSLQGRLWHRVPRAIAVRPIRRRFVRLRRQSQLCCRKARRGGRPASPPRSDP